MRRFSAVSGDEAVKVFLNAAGDKNGIPKELAGFLDYLSGESPKDPFTKNLDVLLQQAREHKEWEVEYMTLAMQYREKYKEGREEGLIEGICKLIRKGYSKEAILDLDYTEEEYAKAEAEVYDPA